MCLQPLKAALILIHYAPFHEAQKMIGQNCIIINTDIFLHWCSGVTTAMTSALAVNHHKIVLLFIDGLIHVNEINQQVFKWAIWYWIYPFHAVSFFLVMFSTNHTTAQQIVNHRYQIDCGPCVLLADYFPCCSMGLPVCIRKQQRKEWERWTIHHAIKQGLMTDLFEHLCSVIPGASQVGQTTEPSPVHDRRYMGARAKSTCSGSISTCDKTKVRTISCTLHSQRRGHSHIIQTIINELPMRCQWGYTVQPALNFFGPKLHH